MLKKKDFVAVVYFIYFSVSFVIFFYHDEPVESDHCAFDYSCVRFCCLDPELCSNEFVAKHFNKSFVSKNKYAEIKILFGKPTCPSLQPLDENVTWSFDSTGRVFTRNLTSYYAPNYYCLESRNNSQSVAIEWDVFHCATGNRFRRVFYDCLMGVALVFVVDSLVVYVLSHSLRTLHGKCEFMFLLGMLLIYLVYPWKMQFNSFRRFFIRILYFGCLMTSVWKNILIFDIWWSFKHRKAPEDELLRFTNYCYYAFGLIGAYLLALLVEQVVWRVNALYTMLTLLVLTTLIEVILLLQTMVNVIRTARTLRSSDHQFFRAERERFKSYFVCSIIFSCSWFAELIFEWNIVSVFLISFSAFLIFANFAWEKLLHLSQVEDEERYLSAEMVAF